MIERYSRAAMKAVWTDQNKFQKWLEVELAACAAHTDMGTIPAPAYKTILKKAKFDVHRILEIEAEVHHDVIAFLTSLAENIGPESRFVHLGLTSSDVVDTAFSLLIQDAGKILITDLEKLLQVLAKQAQTYKLTPMMGRTHGVHAEPLTLGLKLTVWYDEMQRNLVRLQQSLATLKVGKISGAVGNYAHIPPQLEEVICQKLGLEAAPASNQILQRDRHAQFMTTLAIIGGSLEKIATEIRALQKTEFNEITEPFGKNQKGSSAMPHKKNPIICERITGLSRNLRGYALTALENQCLWHERDISHSSAERIIFPDATIVLDYMFSLMTRVIENMNVNTEQMAENLQKSYNVYYSQQLLLKLVDKGMLREDAYRLVQQHAMTCFAQRKLFDQEISQDPAIKKILTKKELASVFDFAKYSQNVDLIYRRVYR